jgi:hypothetical protein
MRNSIIQSVGITQIQFRMKLAGNGFAAVAGGEA